MAYSTQRVTSNGTLVLLDIAIEYFDRGEISVLFDGVVNARPWAWVGSTDTKISFSPAVPNGVEVLLVRVTNLSMRHVFTLGAKFTAQSLDENLSQVLRIAQEQREGATGVTDLYNNLNMHGYSVTNLRAAVANGEAVEYGQFVAHDAAMVAAVSAASASAGAASTSATNAASSATTATLRAGAAESSRTAALTSEQAAAGSATNAAASAASISGSVSVATNAATQALGFKDAAVTSATQAAASAAAAAASAASVDTSALAAAVSAASGSATAAAGSASAAATSASNAATSATASANSATASAASVTAASTQAGNAATSAGTANTRATAAATSATNAATSATEAATSAASAIAAASSASDKVAKTSTTGSAIVPSGTTAQRDASPTNGFLRYNQTLGAFEGYIAGAWGPLAAPSGGGGGAAVSDLYMTSASYGNLSRGILFSTELHRIGADVTYTNLSGYGTKVQIGAAGVYSISCTIGFEATNTLHIVKNVSDASLGTATGITDTLASIIGFNRDAGTGRIAYATLNWCGYLTAGDTLRIRSEDAGTLASGALWFSRLTVTRVL